MTAHINGSGSDYSKISFIYTCLFFFVFGVFQLSWFDFNERLLLIQELINDEDEKLKGLKLELGDEVFKAVTLALIKLYSNTYSNSYFYD